VGGAEPAPLTPAQVQVLRGNQDRVGLRVVKLFLLMSLLGTASHLVLFISLGAHDYPIITAASILDVVLYVVAYLLVRDGRELQGVVLALVVSSVHMLGVYALFSTAASVELNLFPIALAPFLMIRRESPVLRIGLTSFVMSIYLVCKLAFPEGTAGHLLTADVVGAFATGNRILVAVSVSAIMGIIQANMSATRRILEGAARYGELRATTDELTGVYNRRPIVAQLSEWAARGRGNYAIALIDLDHFKTINDEFGHDCGDTVLQEVALTLRSHFREADMVSRWGGDEFLILMPGVRHADLVPVLERLRRAISLIERSCNEHLHHVTVSIGASMGVIGQTPDECIAAADHALYRAKGA